MTQFDYFHQGIAAAKREGLVVTEKKSELSQFYHLISFYIFFQIIHNKSVPGIIKAHMVLVHQI